MLVEPDVQLNITLDFINVPAPPNSPAILLRVDYWDEATKSYPAANSFAFYQTGASVSPAACLQTHPYRAGLLFTDRRPSK